jgi:phospholipid-transporting ATPase
MQNPTNIYFICVAILQMIPIITITGGVPDILMPLIFVILVTGIKDFFEDKKKKDADY